MSSETRPKSVSLLQAFADPDTAALIEGCHDRAVQQALGYLQRHAGHGLRGHHGDGNVMERIGTDGWIVAGFTHYTSRAGDPQLHTHLVLPNLLHGQDGKWSAVDSRAVFRQAKTAGYLCQAALRSELSRELGVNWTEPRKGQAEVVGVPRVVLRAFSERRRQIELALASTGRRGRAATQAACLATRQRKAHISLPVLRRRWEQQLQRLGINGTALVANVRHSPGSALASRLTGRLRASRHAAESLTLTPEQIGHVAALVLGSDGVTAKATTFDRRDLIQALATTLPVEHGAKSLAIEALADELLSQPDSVPLEPTAEGKVRWTTFELLATEQRALILAATRTNPVADRQHLEERFGRRWISAEQQAALRHLATDHRLAAVLVGPAGSGKSAVLACLRELASDTQRPVVGCALAALTARRLQSSSGIPSSSLTALLARLDIEALPAGALVVVDEAGMVGTRQLTRLLEHAHRAGGQVLLVGDPAQLPEIDAGGLFRHLSQPEQDPAILTGNQRQRQPQEVLALEHLRGGRTLAALDFYARHQRIRQSRTREGMYDAVAADYVTATASAASPADARETIVLASYRSDVEALNQQIRIGLQAQERLGPDTFKMNPEEGPVGFAVGDQVIVVRQCSDVDGRKVLNGTRGHLTQASPTRLRLQAETGTEITLEPSVATEALRHGYALTIHKAQGLTATTALVVSDGLTAQSAYTALSRGRERNQLYLHDDPAESSDDDRSPLGRLHDQLRRASGDTLALLQMPGRRSRPRSRSGWPPPAPPEPAVRSR